MWAARFLTAKVSQGGVDSIAFAICANWTRWELRFAQFMVDLTLNPFFLQKTVFSVSACALPQSGIDIRGHENHSELEWYPNRDEIFFPSRFPPTRLFFQRSPHKNCRRMRRKNTKKRSTTTSEKYISARHKANHKNAFFLFCFVAVFSNASKYFGFVLLYLISVLRLNNKTPRNFFSRMEGSFFLKNDILTFFPAPTMAIMCGTICVKSG